MKWQVRPEAERKHRKPWRFPSDRGRMPVPSAESLIGHIGVELPEQPGESLLNLEFIALIEMTCEARGSINEVDSDFYEVFINLSERGMLDIMKATFLAFRKFINALCFNDHPERYTETLGRFMDTVLYLVARGNVLFVGYPDAIMCKPVGPKPTPDQQRRILARIRSDEALQLRAIQELLAEGNRSRAES